MRAPGVLVAACLGSLGCGGQATDGPPLLPPPYSARGTPNVSQTVPARPSAGGATGRGGSSAGGSSATRPPSADGGQGGATSTGGSAAVGGPSMMPPVWDGVAGTGQTPSEPPEPPPPQPALPVPPPGPEACSSLSHFDPDEVYLVGTLVEGSCGYDAIAHWSDPNTALAGFGCYNDGSSAVVRPKGGALITKEIFGSTHVFQPDACLTRAGGPYSYPVDPLANDGVFNFPCTPEVAGRAVAVAPRGNMAFWCGGPWLSDGGAVLYEGEAVVLAFDGEHLLLSSGVFNVAEQTLHPFEGLPEQSPLTWRVLDTGFWLYLENPIAGSPPPELWHVDFEGQAQLLGTYPALPQGINVSPMVRLAADASAFQLGFGEGGNDVVFRRSTAGWLEVVYDEATNPLVKLHGSGLATGP